MSEYTREEILKMIEENSGPRGLDLSRRDLSEIDLSKQTIAKELERIRAAEPGRSPPWQAPSPWGINLEGVKLSEANLERAHLQGAYLFDACLEEANLGYTHLEGAFLFGSRLNRASLFEAHLEGASIGRAYFDQADLCWTHLHRVDLSEASLLGTCFEGAYLSQTRIKKEQLAPSIAEEEQREYQKAGEIYLLLKNNFNQIGRYDDASWAYVKERQMEKMTYHPKVARTYYAKSEGLPESASPKYWA